MDASPDEPASRDEDALPDEAASSDEASLDEEASLNEAASQETTSLYMAFSLCRLPQHIVIAQYMKWHYHEAFSL